MHVAILGLYELIFTGMKDGFKCGATQILSCQHSAEVDLQSKSHILLAKVKASSKAVLTDNDL